MRVADCVPAGWLILDRCNDPEHSLPARVAIDPEAIWSIEFREWLGLNMAAVASLGAFIDDVAEFRRIGRVADPPFLVEDADPHHSRLIRHRSHGVIHAFAVV